MRSTSVSAGAFRTSEYFSPLFPLRNFQILEKKSEKFSLSVCALKRQTKEEE